MAGIIEGLISWTLSLIQVYGPYSVFLAVLMEEILVPIPSALVVMGAGFLLIPAGIPLIDAVAQVFFVIVIPASVAGTLGSFFTYGIGYYGGRPLITKLKVFLGVGWEDVKGMEKKFGDRKWSMITILRAIPIFPIALISLASGVLRLDWKKYAIATFAGSLPRNFVLGLSGWYFGSAYASVAANLNIVENAVLATVIAIILFVLYKKRHHVKNLAHRIRGRKV